MSAVISAADGIVLRTRWESSGKSMSAMIVLLMKYKYSLPDN